MILDVDAKTRSRLAAAAAAAAAFYCHKVGGKVYKDNSRTRPRGQNFLTALLPFMSSFLLSFWMFSQEFWSATVFVFLRRNEKV